MAHEFLHALGFNHEQSRDDRDTYVRINAQNVQPSFPIHNFDKIARTNNQDEDYDYCSFMHYSAFAASKNGLPTIEPLRKDKKCSDPREVGRSTRITDTDIRDRTLALKALLCDSGPLSGTIIHTV